MCFKKIEMCDTDDIFPVCEFQKCAPSDYRDAKGSAIGVAVGKKETAKPLGSCRCAYCGKQGGTKRCTKRHRRCLQLLFCDRVCEEAAHRRRDGVKKEAEEGDKCHLESPEDEKAAASKKRKQQQRAKKVVCRGSLDYCQDQFWWNNG